MKCRETCGPASCPGPMRRREFLRTGLAAFGSLSLPALLRMKAQAGPAATREKTAVIVVWLHGGATHLETYDPKPNAAAEFRGPFSPIATRTPGLDVCELLPRHAAISDKFAILRSMVHTGFCHQQGQQQLFTGHPVRELKQKPDNPDCLTIANRLRWDANRSIPNYVGVAPMPYIGSAYLGPAYEPFAVSGDPNAPNFQVPNIGLGDASQVAHLQQRRGLRASFDRLRRDLDRLGDMHALDSFEEQAWGMLTSPEAQRAFDISREDPRVRDRYGRSRWGQQCLLARRLVEAGVELVTTTFYGVEGGQFGNWDDHAVNCHCFDAMKERAPVFDQAVTALIEDLYARGLDRRVLLVVTGEFGRTPRISYANGRPGRDHWPSATSMLFAGGGIEGGQVIGATDSRGEQVVERRVGVGDFLATIYRHLGIDAKATAFTNFAGRPVPILPEGEAIRELIGTV